MDEEREGICNRVIFQELAPVELQWVASQWDRSGVVTASSVADSDAALQCQCSHEEYYNCSLLCKLLAHVQRPDLVELVMQEVHSMTTTLPVSHALEISPSSFQVSAQLLYFKLCHFSHLHLQCYLDMNLKCACTGIENYTAVLGLSSSCTCLPSNDARLLLSKLMQNKLELRNCGYTFLAFFDSKEELANRGIALDHCSDTDCFEWSFSTIMEDATKSLQSSMRGLIQPCSCSPHLRSSIVNEILRQYLYWIDSRQLSAALEGKVSIYTQSGNMSDFKLSSNSDVLFVCNAAFQPVVVMNWYQSQLIRELLSMVNDRVCRLHLQSALEEMLKYGR